MPLMILLSLNTHYTKLNVEEELERRGDRFTCSLTNVSQGKAGISLMSSRLATGGQSTWRAITGTSSCCSASWTREPQTAIQPHSSIIVNKLVQPLARCPPSSNISWAIRQQLRSNIFNSLRRAESILLTWIYIVMEIVHNSFWTVGPCAPFALNLIWAGVTTFFVEF